MVHEDSLETLADLQYFVANSFLLLVYPGLDTIEL